MKKRLGQNFLIDKNIAFKIVGYADIKSEDIVLEIGPGHGILTNILAEKAKKVIAIEIDQEIVKYLETIRPDNVKLIRGDVLKIDFNSLPWFNKIVSNLPYNISSDITFKLLCHKFELAILTYQKEFAERLISAHNNKNYSRLSVGVYYKAECKFLDQVSKNCFNPTPNVDSYVLSLKPRSLPPFYVINEKFFFDFIRNMFIHRRKKIKRILISRYKINLVGLPFLDKRIENLSPEEIGNLCNLVYGKISE